MSGASGPEVPRHAPWVEPCPPLAADQLPRCAVVVLNWNGRHHLAGCLDSLAALDYPAGAYRVVLVDNGSSDGSVEAVRRSHPAVRVLENDRNRGFSAGSNQGALEAEEADVLVFLNNDMRVEPGFLRALVAPVARGLCAASTARMLSWDGKRMNSAGGGMNFHGIGIQRGYEEPLGPEFERPCLTLFACGGAMAMDARTFRDVGGFDEEFFAYYEDVDLGWRTWVLGHSVRYEPGAVCYHHHSSTSQRVPIERLRVLQVRNPLLACFKNYDEANLRRILPAMLALAARRAFVAGGLHGMPGFRIEDLPRPARAGWLGRLGRALARRGSRGRSNGGSVALADLVAINDLVGQWDHWMERRSAVQARRRRSDEEIFRLFLHPLWCIEDDYGYRELQAGLVRFLGIDEMFAGLTRMDKDPLR